MVCALNRCRLVSPFVAAVRMQAELEPGTFCGLALDEDNQGELTDDRVAAWTAQVLQEMKVKAVA